MGLYEKWSRDDPDEPKIPVHAFGAALSELARGSITRAQLIAAFSLAGDEVTELDAIIATYTGLVSTRDKDFFIAKLEDVMILAESGHYDKAKCKTELGF
jgi:hypothetical protein